MIAEPDIAKTAALLAQAPRAAMVVALMDSRALPAGELAKLAGVSAQTASTHLKKLVDAGFLSVVSQGRHRYYRLASARIAAAIETLSAIAPLPKIRSLNESLLMRKLSRARTCYDHLAGQLAIELVDALVARGDLQPLDDGFAIMPRGVAFFGALGIEVRSLCKGNPPIARSCIDWTQRRQHLSGPLGRELLAALIERGYLERSRGDRAIKVEPSREQEFRDLFGFQRRFLQNAKGS